jgi:hypothetical protein
MMTYQAATLSAMPSLQPDAWLQQHWAFFERSRAFVATRHGLMPCRKLQFAELITKKKDMRSSGSAIALRDKIAGKLT